MTDQSRIDRNNARPASLFERAEAAFDLGTPRVPTGLPEPRTPAAPAPRVPSRPPAPQPIAAPAPAPVAAAPVAPDPAPEPARHAPEAVQFTGPVQRIDRGALRCAGLIVPEDPVTGLLEEFRIVKREILADMRASSDPMLRRVLVCSPHSGEGKTYCATNLAIALAAERGTEVVLVDADVIKPSVCERLGLEATGGLMDALADPAIAPESLVIATDIEGLFVLPAGTASVLDSEYLASERTGEVLDRLTRGAPNRVLIFDTPPALAASPAAELAAHVGQALLVARAEETSRVALEDARQLLSACANIKLLLNAARYSLSGRRFGNYGAKGD